MPSSDKIIIHADPEIKEIIPMFLENRRKDVEAIGEALKKKNLEAVRRLGHQMKGAGGGYGFDGISKIGADLEVCAMQADAKGAQKALRELEDYLRRVVVVDA